MSSAIPIIAIVLALAAIEGLAWWWMNPATAATGEPVLAYRPRVNAEKLKTEMLKEEEASAPDSSSSNPKSTINNPQSSISPSSISASQRFSISASTTLTPLPELYRQAAPMLRCSGGEVFRVDTADDNLTLHLAWFEWDGTDTGSVLEAFRHMPEACMGSIGMKLVSKEKPIRYTIRGQEAGDREQETGDGGQGSEIRGQKSEVRGQAEAAAQSSSSSSSATDHCSLLTAHSSSIQNSKFATQSLSFDHTIFREPGQGGGVLVPGPLVHSFRAVWVSGMPQADARRGIDGRELDRLRSIRLKAAATRYRPPHACVVQGTVRGAPNADAAWQAFEHHMLRDLTLQR
jgi:hypothetical protein